MIARAGLYARLYHEQFTDLIAREAAAEETQETLAGLA